jgi:cytidylate kinase
MSAITISRQKGSLGCQVAFTVADVLGYKLVWRELINEAARRSGTPEVALAAIDELGLLGFCPSPDACRAYHRAVNDLMLELVEQGEVVILGRAGQVILRNRRDTLHVRLVAPISDRIARIAQHMGTSDECARAQVEASDRYRSNYLRRFYYVNWDDPTLYHLIINTGSLQMYQVVETICQTFQKCIASGFTPEPE